MIYKFEEYQTNEGLIGDFLKKMMMKMLPEDLQKKIAAYQDRFGKSKNQNDLLNNVKNSFLDMQKEFDEKVKPVTNDNVKDLKEITSDNLSLMYLTMKGLSTSTNNKRYSPENFFVKTDFEKMFVYKDPKDFDKNLQASTIAFLTNVGGKVGVKPEQIKRMFEQTPDEENKTQEQKPEENKQNTAQDMDTQTTGEGGGLGQSETKIFNFDSFQKIFEADEPQFDVEKFKTELSKEWKLFTENVYKGIEKNVKNSGGAGNAIAAIAKQNSTEIGSKPDNLQNFYKSIINIKDKNELIKLRDLMAKNKIAGFDVDTFNRKTYPL